MCEVSPPRDLVPTASNGIEGQGRALVAAANSTVWYLGGSNAGMERFVERPAHLLASVAFRTKDSE